MKNSKDNICRNSNLNCDKCKIKNCKKRMKLFEKVEMEKNKKELEYIKKQLPEQCRNCSFFVVTNVSKHEVHCPYMFKKCILK